MRTRYVVAALAASLALAASGTAGASSSGVVPAGRPAWATLARPVAVVEAGAAGAGTVSVVEGATGFPVSVTESGAAGSDGAVPGGDCLSLTVHGRQVAAGRADAHGRFALTGAVPTGAVATVRWGPCGGSETGQRRCHNTTSHETNANQDEARSAGQGCSTAGDAGPDS